MRRVYGHLEERFGEEYGLLFIFTMRTAVELHRAWNMTLLTATVLQEIKDKFNLRMTVRLLSTALTLTIFFCTCTQAYLLFCPSFTA